MSNVKRVTSFTVDRALWGRGELLRHDDDKMCCLGHLAKACNIDDSDLYGQGFPTQDMIKSGYPEDFARNDFGVAFIAAEINDSRMPYREKEQRLKILFKSRGVTIRFKGKGAP